MGVHSIKNAVNIDTERINRGLMQALDLGGTKGDTGIGDHQVEWTFLFVGLDPGFQAGLVDDFACPDGDRGAGITTLSGNFVKALMIAPTDEQGYIGRSIVPVLLRCRYSLRRP